MTASVGLVTLYGNNGQTRLAIHLAETLKQLGCHVKLFDDSHCYRVPTNHDWDGKVQPATIEQLRRCRLVLWLAGQDAKLLPAVRRRTRVGFVVHNPANKLAVKLAARSGFAVCLSEAVAERVQQINPTGQRIVCPLSSNLPILDRTHSLPKDKHSIFIPGLQLASGEARWYDYASMILEQHPDVSLTVHKLPGWLRAWDRQQLRRLRDKSQGRLSWHRCWSHFDLTQQIFQHSALLWHDPGTFNPEALYAAHLGVPVITTSTRNSEYLDGCSRNVGVVDTNENSLHLLSWLSTLLNSRDDLARLRHRNMTFLAERQAAFRSGLESLVR